jgi:hypothetical protein
MVRDIVTPLCRFDHQNLNDLFLRGPRSSHRLPLPRIHHPKLSLHLLLHCMIHLQLIHHHQPLHQLLYRHQQIHRYWQRPNRTVLVSTSPTLLHNFAPLHLGPPSFSRYADPPTYTTISRLLTTTPNTYYINSATMGHQYISRPTHGHWPNAIKLLHEVATRLPLPTHPSFAPRWPTWLASTFG